MSFPLLQPRSFGSDVYMVPDDEVHQCPICTKKFQPVLVPKHHCRNCGKVVCGTCSSNQMTLAGTKGKQRVCDNCYRLLNHAKGESLTEDHLNHETLKKSLSSNIQEKRKQKDWFKQFLAEIRISDDTEKALDPSFHEEDFTTFDEHKTLEDSGPSVLRPHEEEFQASMCTLQPEFRDLVMRARKEWKEACADVARKRRDNDQLEQEILRVDTEHGAVAREIEKIQREIKNMVQEKGETQAMEAIRDKLRETTTQQQEELDGLERRMSKLISDRNTVAFSQGPSSIGESDSCQQRCRDRFRPDGCGLM